MSADRDPTEEDLEEAYATDVRTADDDVDTWSTAPTVAADWWPEGQEAQSAHLCGRWWVSQDGGTFYGFGAESGWAPPRDRAAEEKKNGEVQAPTREWFLRSKA